MKWLAWCHDNAIKGSFGVDTSYAKIPHGTLLANTLNICARRLVSKICISY